MVRVLELVHWEEVFTERAPGRSLFYFFWVVCKPDVLRLQIYLASFRQSQWEEICFPRKNLRPLDALLKRILALGSEGRSHLKKK